MRLFVTAVLVVGLMAGAPQAMAQAYSGTTGASSGSIGTDPTAPQPKAPTTLPPVFQGTADAPQAASNPPALPTTPTAPVAPQVPTVPQANGAQPGAAAAGQLDAGKLPEDPCAAFLSNYQYYAACQDREKRLERMKELKEKREAAAAERRKAYEERKKAAEEAREKAANAPKLLRPGEKPLPTKEPQKVEVVQPDADGDGDKK